MRPAYRFLSALFIASVLAMVLAARGPAAELATAPPEVLMQIYAQLRQLKTADQWAAAERVSLRRDAATFTFTKAPGGGRIDLVHVGVSPHAPRLHNRGVDFNPGTHIMI
jgi:phosphate-selective porin